MAKVRVQVLLQPENYIFLEKMRIEYKKSNTSEILNVLIHAYKKELEKTERIKEYKQAKVLDEMDKKYGLDKVWKE